MLRHAGMCRKNGLVFARSSKHGSHVSWKKCVTIGLICEPQKIFWKFDVFLWQNRKKWVLFFWGGGISLNMGTYFWKIYTLNMDVGLELLAAHPRPIQIWIPLGIKPLQHGCLAKPLVWASGYYDWYVQLISPPATSVHEYISKLTKVLIIRVWLLTRITELIHITSHKPESKLICVEN